MTDSTQQHVPSTLGRVFKDTDGAAASARWRRFEAARGVPPIELPPGYRVVQVDTPSCEKLRDVVSLRWDLESTVSFLDAYLDQPDVNEPQQRPASEGLWTAAVVSYGRAFGSGVRLAERLDLADLDESEAESHHYFIDLRNKHVAHSVNSLEQVIPLAYLTDSAFAPRRVTRTGQTHVSVNPMTEEAAHALRGLAKKFIRRLDIRVRELHMSIAAELGALGADTVYAFEDIGVVLPQREDITKSRRKR